MRHTDDFLGTEEREYREYQVVGVGSVFVLRSTPNPKP